MKEVDKEDKILDEICDMCEGIGWYTVPARQQAGGIIDERTCMCSCQFKKDDSDDMDDDIDDRFDGFNPFQQGGLGIITRV